MLMTSRNAVMVAWLDSFPFTNIPNVFMIHEQFVLGATIQLADVVLIILEVVDVGVAETLLDRSSE